MFKVLVSAACVAVIAIAGLLFWQAQQAAEAHAAKMKDARIRGECSTTAPGQVNAHAVTIRDWCAKNGYIELN